MGGAAQVAMHVASQILQVVFASQTLQVFCLALRKKAQYVVVVLKTLKFFCTCCYLRVHDSHSNAFLFQNFIYLKF
jgi:hypothetical protein